MRDYELVAEVFDGGWGWHPLLPEALKAWNRLCQRFGDDFMNSLITRWITVKYG